MLEVKNLHVMVDGKKIGKGHPGPVSQKLFKALRERLDKVGAATARG